MATRIPFKIVPSSSYTPAHTIFPTFVALLEVNRGGFGSNSRIHFPDITSTWHDIFLTLLCPDIHFPDIYFSDNFISWHSFSWHQCGFPDTHFTQIISVYFNVYWWLGYNYSMRQCGQILNYTTLPRHSFSWQFYFPSFIFLTPQQLTQFLITMEGKKEVIYHLRQTW